MEIPSYPSYLTWVLDLIHYCLKKVLNSLEFILVKSSKPCLLVMSLIHYVLREHERELFKAEIIIWQVKSILFWFPIIIIKQQFSIKGFLIRKSYNTLYRNKAGKKADPIAIHILTFTEYTILLVVPRRYGHHKSVCWI